MSASMLVFDTGSICSTTNIEVYTNVGTPSIIRQINEILEYQATADCGTVIHPQGLSNQIRGGGIMGIGLEGVDTASARIELAGQLLGWLEAGTMAEVFSLARLKRLEQQGPMSNP